MVTVRSYAPAGELHWESDVNGAIRVGVSAKHGGSDENRTPEHLYTAALLNCFLASFQVIARKSGLAYDAIEGRADATVERRDGVTWVSECRIDAIVHGCDDRERGADILERAERACTIKNSVETHVEINAAFSDA